MRLQRLSQHQHNINRINLRALLRTGFGLSQVLTISSLFAAPAEQPETKAILPTAKIVRQFRALDLSYTGGRYQGKMFSYRLYTPQRVDNGKTYPLVLWFHGAGESGNDNYRHLVHIADALFRYKQKHGPFPGFVLAPQVPKVNDWFRTAGAPDDDDMLAVSWSMLQRTIQDYPIDTDRIFVAGVSSGGSAVWEMAVRHPGYFAAAAPISSSGGDQSRAANLVGTPVWAFNNVYDKQASIVDARRMIAAVRLAGGRAKLTEITNIGHDAWIQALYTNSALLEWLLERRRGESGWNCYYGFVDWPIIAIQCGLPLLLLATAAGLVAHRQYTKRTARLRNLAAVRSSLTIASPDLSLAIGTKDESIAVDGKACP